MKQVTVTVILSHILKDRMMHAVDVFESWKVLMEPAITFSAGLSKGETVESIFAKGKTVLEGTAQYRVIAMFQPGLEEGAWCDRQIIVVSNGLQFLKFYTFLQSHHYVGPMPRQYIDEPIPV